VAASIFEPGVCGVRVDINCIVLYYLCTYTNTHARTHAVMAAATFELGVCGMCVDFYCIVSYYLCTCTNTLTQTHAVMVAATFEPGVYGVCADFILWHLMCVHIQTHKHTHVFIRCCICSGTSCA